MYTYKWSYVPPAPAELHIASSKFALESLLASANKQKAFILPMKQYDGFAGKRARETEALRDAPAPAPARQHKLARVDQAADISMAATSAAASRPFGMSGYPAVDTNDLFDGELAAPAEPAPRDAGPQRSTLRPAPALQMQAKSQAAASAGSTVGTTTGSLGLRMQAHAGMRATAAAPLSSAAAKAAPGVGVFTADELEEMQLATAAAQSAASSAALGVGRPRKGRTADGDARGSARSSPVAVTLDSMRLAAAVAPRGEAEDSDAIASFSQTEWVREILPMFLRPGLEASAVVFNTLLALLQDAGAGGDLGRDESTAAELLAALQSTVVGATAGGIKPSLSTMLSRCYLSWTLVGGRDSPNTVVAAVFFVRGGPVSQECYVLPLVADSVLRSIYSQLYGPAVNMLKRAERWMVLNMLLSLPQVPKPVFNAKQQLYPLMQTEQTKSAIFSDLCDPAIAAFLISTESMTVKDTAANPRRVLPGRPVGLQARPPETSPVLTKHVQSGIMNSSAFAVIGKDEVTLPVIAAVYFVATPPTVTAMDVWAYLRCNAELMTTQALELRVRGLEETFTLQEMKLVPVLAAVEVTGLALSPKVLQQLDADLRADKSRLERNICDLTGRPSPDWVSSSTKVSQYLFDELKLTAPEAPELYKRHRAAQQRHRSVAADAIDQLIAKYPQHAVLLRCILEYRKVSKMINTFTSALPESARAPTRTTGGGSGSAAAAASRPSLRRIHTILNQTNTATGRLSSSNPNLQNIPTAISAKRAARTEGGSDGSGAAATGATADTEAEDEVDVEAEDELPSGIRAAFVAPGDDWLLVSLDYKQIEVRLAAHFSKDPGLLAAFRTDQRDIYASIAERAFGQSPPTPLQRTAAKVALIGMLYGSGIQTLAHQLGVSEDRARDFRDAVTRRFSGVNSYTQRVRHFASEHGHVLTLSGRRRVLADSKSVEQNRQSAAQRQAVNSVIQGTGADLIKQAMILVDERLRLSRSATADALDTSSSSGASAESGPPLAARLVLQVHDELLLEVHRSCLDEVIEMVSRIMTEEAPRRLAAISRLSVFDRITPRTQGSAVSDEQQYLAGCAGLLGHAPDLCVPLAVSVEVGRDWANMEPYTKTT